MQGRAWSAVLWGGLAAGIGDSLLALGMYPVSLVVIYQSVASGLLGREAFRGGLATAALGMLLHFFIATTAAAVYVLASSKLKPLLTHAVPCGLAFGVAVYFFMKQVVVPLSAARPGPFAWAGMIGHALLVGLPIALIVRRALSEGPQFVTVRGHPSWVVISQTEFTRLKKRRSRRPLVELFRDSPIAGAEFDLTRSRDTGRRVDL